MNMEELEAKRAEVILKKNALQIRLSEITNKIRGKILPNNEYRDLSDQQFSVKKKVQWLENELIKINRELKPHKDKQNEERQAGFLSAIGRSGGDHSVQVAELNLEIKRLRSLLAKNGIPC